MGCVTAVTPYLDKAAGVESWAVDLATPEKILTVKYSAPVAPEAVQEALRKAGYSAEPIPG